MTAETCRPSSQSIDRGLRRNQGPCGPNVNRETRRSVMRATAVRVQSMFLAIAIAAAASGCGDDAAPTTEVTPTTVVQFAITSDNLPACGNAINGAVWYVWSTGQFVVCKGSTRTWTPINLNGF